MSGTITAAQIDAALGGVPVLTSDVRITQPAQPIETFYQATDRDFSAAMVRAATANVPFLLGPRTYVANSPLTRGLPYWMFGTRGASVLQRTNATGGAWLIFDTDVIAEGIVFDAGAGVSTTLGGVTVQGATRAHFHHCTIINNRGPLGAPGSGLDITGPADATVIPDYVITDCNIYNNIYAGVLATQVQQFTIQNCSVHDNDWNQAPAISVTAFTNVTATPANTKVTIRGNRCWHGAHGIVLDGNGSPVNISQPLTSDLDMVGNTVWDVGGYAWKLSAGNMKVTDNAAIFSATRFVNAQGTFNVSGGGADYTAISVRTSNNSVRLLNAAAIAGNPSQLLPWGFDYGGCQDVVAVQDTVDGAAIAFSCGATIRTRLHLCGAKNFQTGVTNPGVDSGAGVAKNQLAASVTVDTCQLELNGTGAVGVYSYAGSTGCRLIGNRFYGINGAVPNQAVVARTQFSACTGNEWNDSSEYLVTNAPQQGDPDYVTSAGTMPTTSTLVVPDVFDSVYIREQPGQSKLSLMTQATWTCQTKIVQVLPYGKITIGGKQVTLSPGSGYTVMNITDSAGNTYQPFLTATGATVQYQGASYAVPPGGLLGARPTSMTGNFPSSVLMTVTGNGTGAVLAGIVGVPVPRSKRVLVKTGPGVAVTFANAGGITLAPLGVAEAVELAGNLAWG